MMSRRPSFQFYPADWRNNAKLRRCSWAARGAWVEIMCLMHDSDEYGVLRWTLREIAHATGVHARILSELTSKGVLRGSNGKVPAFVYTPRHAGKDGVPVELIQANDGPCWFSSRLVRDEYVRMVRGAGGRFGDDERGPNTIPKPPFGMRQGDGSSSSTSSSSKDTSSLRSEVGARAKKKIAAEIPDWVPGEAWAGFVEMRSRIRAPLTGYGTTLLLAKLTKLRDEGHDPAAVLNQSTLHDWRGLFAIKPEITNGSGRKPSTHQNHLDGIGLALAKIRSRVPSE